MNSKLTKEIEFLIKETIAKKIMDEDITKFLVVDEEKDTIKFQMEIGFLFAIRDLELRLAFKNIK